MKDSCETCGYYLKDTDYCLMHQFEAYEKSPGRDDPSFEGCLFSIDDQIEMISQAREYLEEIKRKLPLLRANKYEEFYSPFRAFVLVMANYINLKKFRNEKWEFEEWVPKLDEKFEPLSDLLMSLDLRIHQLSNTKLDPDYISNIIEEWSSIINKLYIEEWREWSNLL